MGATIDERELEWASIAWGEWPSAELLCRPDTVILAGIAIASADFCRAAIDELERRSVLLKDWLNHRVEINRNLGITMSADAWDALADARAAHRMYRRALGQRLEILRKGEEAAS